MARAATSRPDHSDVRHCDTRSDLAVLVIRAAVIDASPRPRSRPSGWSTRRCSACSYIGNSIGAGSINPRGCRSLTSAVMLIIGAATALMAWALTRSGIFAMAGGDGGDGAPGGAARLSRYHRGHVCHPQQRAGRGCRSVLFSPLLFPVAKGDGRYWVHYLSSSQRGHQPVPAPPFGVGAARARSRARLARR